MKVVLDGVPIEKKIVPEGIVQVRIDRDSGLLTNSTGYETRFEYFKRGTEPHDYNKDVFDATYTSGRESLF